SWRQFRAVRRLSRGPHAQDVVNLFVLFRGSLQRGISRRLTGAGGTSTHRLSARSSGSSACGIRSVGAFSLCRKARGAHDPCGHANSLTPLAASARVVPHRPYALPLAPRWSWGVETRITQRSCGSSPPLLPAEDSPFAAGGQCLART